MPAKKKTAKKTTRKTGIKKGSKLGCSVCGVVMTVNEACGCIDVCDLICCGKQMKVKRS